MDKPKDPNKVAMGLRIAQAREEAGLTQEQLGERVGVSYQAVSRWELGETTPRNKSVYKHISAETGKSIPWILYGVEQAENDASLRQSGEVGQIVPSVAPNNITRFLGGDSAAVEGYSRTYFPCGGRAFKTVVTDTANAPELQPGDVVIIDPDLAPRPDDFVAVLHKGAPTLRVFSEDSGHYKFVPLNDRHSKVEADSLDDVFLGTVTETCRNRRK